MPVRTAAPSSSAATRKTSAHPATGGGRAASATPSIAIPEEPSVPSISPRLRVDICAIFADSQRSATGHRKLMVRLRKIQEGCCGIVPKGVKQKKKDGEQRSIPAQRGEDSAAEKEFDIEMSRCILRVLAIKKTEPVGDRVIRFLGTFLGHASEKGECPFPRNLRGVFGAN